QPRLDVLGQQRLAQQRVAHQVDLPDGQVVGRPPVGVDPGQFFGAQRRTLDDVHQTPSGRSRSGPACPTGRSRRQGPSARYRGAVADILVLNAGSSTLKYRLFPSDAGPNGGVVERIGEPGGAAADHGAAVHRVLERLSGKAIGAVGHRIVHGGTRFREPIVVDDAVLQAIREVSVLAPLHNPAGVAGIEAARQALPGVPQVAVFDTAFHATLPEAAATYALDRDLARRYGVRRYGFHGISVGWVAAGTARLLDRPLAE